MSSAHRVSPPSLGVSLHFPPWTLHRSWQRGAEWAVKVAWTGESEEDRAARLKCGKEVEPADITPTWPLCPRRGTLSTPQSDHGQGAGAARAAPSGFMGSFHSGSES